VVVVVGLVLELWLAAVVLDLSRVRDVVEEEEVEDGEGIRRVKSTCGTFRAAKERRKVLRERVKGS